MTAFHPELRLARFIPPFSFGPLVVALLSRAKPRIVDPGPDVVVEEWTVPGPAGAPEVELRILRPAAPATTARPALLWIHGGGYVIGSPIRTTVRSSSPATLGSVVASVDYRLAPEHPSPAAGRGLLRGAAVAARRAAAGVDPQRIAIGGASAGGGLAAALALLARDRGEVRPAFQLLVYPMLDDRTVAARPTTTPRPPAHVDPGQQPLRLAHLPGRTRPAPTSRRTRPRPASRTCPGCRRPGSASAPSTCSTTRTSPTPTGCGRRGCRARSRWCPARSTVSTLCSPGPG